MDNCNELLRFATAGSVDDGKSTLIGRLLFECKAIYADQFNSIEKTCKRLNKDEIDLALLTDGLESEREQGITIDVAHRYFSTKKRQFIIADSPGHVEYTRNFITAASTADLVVILVDAKEGFNQQTKRHLLVSSLLNMPHILIAINKMDLVDYSESQFDKIKSEIIKYSSKLNIRDLQFIPISALKGDGVTKSGKKMDWYSGQTFLGYLENLHIASDRNLIDPRFPIQLSLRPHANFRGLAGRIEGGVLKTGEEIMILPSGKTTRIKSILNFDEELEYAFNGQSIVLTLTDEIDASRGDMIVRPNNIPEISDEIEAMIWWMDENPMDIGKTYIIKHTTQQCSGFIEHLYYSIDVKTLHREKNEKLELNDIGRIKFKAHKPLIFDPYLQNSNTGSFILIDKFTNNTVAGGIILQRSNKPTCFEG